MTIADRRRRFITNAAYYAVIAALVFLAFRYVLPIVWPFGAAFLFAWIMQPAIRRLTQRRRWRRGAAVVVCLIVFFAVLSGLLALLTSQLLSLGSSLVSSLPSLYSDSILPGLERLSAGAEELAARLGPEAVSFVESASPDIISSVGSAVTDLSMQLVSALSGTAAALPRVLLSGLICIISTVFMTLDFPRITAFIMRQLSDRARVVVHEAKNTFVRVVVQYLKSYGIIMLITFAEIFIGLLIIGQRHAGLIAFAVAVFDILPVVGAWLVLVPWGIVELISGAAVKGLGLLVLWIVEVVVRQIIEPHIVGQHVGLHPVVTLSTMYIGTKLFGGPGLFGLPILCAIIQSLDAAGVVHILKHDGGAQTQASGHPPEKI